MRGQANPRNKRVVTPVAFMDSTIRSALDNGGIADITTIGRKTGLARRIEIYFHQFDGELYLTGRPGPKRDWEANIEARPEFTLHFKGGVRGRHPGAGSIRFEPIDQV